MQRAATVVLLMLASFVVPAGATAGVIQPGLDPAHLVYDDELEYDDGFRVTERVADGGERELVYERTSGEQPLRSIRPGCVEESSELVRCRDLGAIQLVRLDLVAGHDVADASGVRSFRVRAYSGSGNAVLTGGALDDELVSNNGDDRLNGGPGADRLVSDGSEFSPDRDVLDGGPGRDSMLTGRSADVVLARDGERDVVDCGTGDDVVIADAVDDLTACETVELPPREAAAPGSSPAPAPAAPAPGAAPTAPPPAGADAAQTARRERAAITIRCVRPGLVRVAARTAGGFRPAKVTAGSARAKTTRRGALKVDVRVAKRSRPTVRATATGRDGRRLVVTKRLKRC